MKDQIRKFLVFFFAFFIASSFLAIVNAGDTDLFNEMENDAKKGEVKQEKEIKQKSEQVKPSESGDSDLFNEMEKESKPEAGKQEKSTKSGDTDLFNEMEKGETQGGTKQEKKEAKPEKLAEPEKDEFSEMESQSVKEAKKDDNIAAPLIKQLSKNFEGNLKFKYAYYFLKAQKRENADLNDEQIDYLLKFSTYTGGEKWRIDLTGWAEGGKEDKTYAGFSRWFQDTDNRRRHLEFNELYLTLNQKTFDTTFGKKIFTNGINTLASPSDRFRPGDGHDPVDPKEFGIWQGRIDYYLDNFKLTGAILPVFTYAKIPDSTSRWMGSQKGGNNILTDFDFKGEDNSQIVNEMTDIQWSNVGYFGRAKTTFKGWDFAFSLYGGPNPYYVLQEKKKYEEVGGIQVERKIRLKKTTRVEFVSTGFSTTYKKWELHGEALYNHSNEGKDDCYVSYAGGFTYTIDEWANKLFLERIDATIEYGGEFLTREKYAPTYVVSSLQTRAGRNDILARINMKYNEDLSFQYISNIDLAENGRFDRIESEYKIRDGLTLTIACEFFDGLIGSRYGRWWKNDRIVTDIEYKF